MRIQVCKDWLKVDLEENLFNRVVTGDESCHPCDKKQWTEWRSPDEPRPKEARMSKAKVKSILIAFFDCCGMILEEWVPPNQIVKRLDLWKDGWVLHQNTLHYSLHGTLPSFWPKIIPQYFHTFHTPRILFCAILFYFQKWKMWWRVSTWRQYRDQRWFGVCIEDHDSKRL